uniref:Major facilitator superfamily (MFS) profile domain-containing protein n=1 Tax=Caenorhabditis japonica TaxID=281687 RepID=A0A8R1HU35_CAEJA
MAILSCALQLSNIICMPVSGILCESSLGWRSIYYLFGGLTFVSYVVFWLTYSDDPKLHRNVSHKELSKISEGKVKKIRKAVPYYEVCTDPTVLSSWISCFGGNLGFFVLALYGPTYLREILKFDVRETGFLSALPFILAAIAKFACGQISDKLSFLSEKARFVFFAAASQLGLAAGFVVMAFTSSRLIAQIAFNFAIVSSGLNIMGVIKCVQLRCLQHVHFAIAVISFTAYVVQFLAPIVVGIICPDNTVEQWTLLFLIITAFIIVCNASFPFVTKSDAADYTKQEEKSDKSNDI